MSFSIKAGDRLPKLRATLSDADGAIDLTAATGVQFRFHNKATGVTKTGTATVVSAASGVVEYEWAAGDTSAPGDCWGEFVITWSGLLETVPSSGYVEFTIDKILS